MAPDNYLCEYGDLDELWLMVSPQNPFKAKSTDLWNDELPLELARLAVEDYPKFHASDFEFHLPHSGFEINENPLPPRVQLVKTPMLEVSSTFIRESLKQGKDIRYFLHPKVWQKISELPSKQEEGNLHD